MVNEQDGLQLPPALRIAANSGRGRKQKKQDERMTLKNDAKAMRLRLTQMDDKTDSISAASSRYIDTTLACPATGPGAIAGKDCASSGKYSDEILKKKIKKAEKMSDKSTPGSKEFRGLQKKLIEYRSQLQQQKQQDDAHVTRDGSFHPAEVEQKEWIEEKEEETNSDTLSVEIDEEEAVFENRIEGKVKEHKDQNTYSLEMLKKKLKKLEKMLHKSTPGSKEYKKLQQKRMEYKKNIKDQDAIDSITEDRERKSRFQRIEEIDVARRNALRDQSKLSWQRSFEQNQEKDDSKEVVEMGEEEFNLEEAKQEAFGRLEKEAKESKQKEGERQQRDQPYYFRKYTREKRKVDDSEPVPSLFNSYTHHGEDEKTKKRAYVEEARRLKKEALEKRRREEELLKNAEVKEDIEVKKEKSSPLGISATEAIQSNNLDENETETFKNTQVDDDYQRKKQSYLEEARRLKKEALEKKRKEEELRNKTETKEDEEVENKKNSSLLGISATEETQSNNSDENETFKNALVDDDYQRKKQSYLEEARRLKQEALEKKRKEEELQNKAETKEDEEVKNKKKSSLLGISATEETQSNNSEENEAFKSKLVDDDYQRKKQSYLEEARRLKQEAMRKKSKDAEDIDERQHTDDKFQEVKYLDEQCSKKVVSIDKTSQIQRTDDQRTKPGFLAQIRSKADEPKKYQQEDDSTPSTDPAIHGKNSNFSEEIKSITEEKEDEQKCDPISSTDPVVHGKKSNFLEELKSRAEGQKGDEQKCDSASSTDPVVHEKKPKLLEELKSRAEGQKGGEQKCDSTSFTDPVIHEKKPNLLEELKSRAEGQKGDEHKYDSTSSTDPAIHRKKSNFLDFLEEIESKAEWTERDEQQGGSTSFSESTLLTEKPNFLEELKSKAETKEGKEEKQQDDSVPSNDSTVHRKKPNFLEELKSKAEGQNGDKQKCDSTSSTDSAIHGKKPNFLDFLEEIESKAEWTDGYERQGDSTSFSESTLPTKKPNFLEELKSKAEAEEAQQSDFDSSCESSMREKNPNAESMEANIEQSEQTDERETENIQSAPEGETVATPTKQQEEASKDYLDRRTLPKPLSNNTKKILTELESNEIRQKRLERSLTQNGIHIAEDIPYEEAKDKIAEIADSMKALTTAGMDSYTMEKEYFRLEEQLSKYTTALMLTDEYAEEHRRLEQEWEDSIETDNIAAIRKLRSHMPVKIRHLTEEELVSTATPNGKALPKVIARKFKRTNILQLLRVDPDDIEMMHPSTLESMRTTGLILTERRALHEHFRDVVERWAKKRSDPSIEKKWQWYEMLKSKFKETLTAYIRCIDQFGPPGSHQYAKRGDPKGGGCSLLGNQCPIKANGAIDYSNDYGYTKEAAYESSDNRSESKKVSPRDVSKSKEKLSDVTESSEAEMMQEHRDRLRLDTNETEVDKKLLRELFHSDKRTKSLEKQLTHAGLSLPKEDISYHVAKTRIAELTEEFNKVTVNMGNTDDAKLLAKLEHSFGALSQELDKYTNALMLTKEWAQEQKDKERQWEIAISAANCEALQKVRRHMPVNIRNVSETSLATDLTPNGKVLPKAVAKKFKRTNILMILRTDPSAIEVMHPSSLEAMRTTGLTLTERRAIHEHLKDIAPKWKAMSRDKMCERKWMWHASLQSKLKEMLVKYDKDVEQYGPPGNHSYRKRNDCDGVGCPLIGNQCPVKADLATDYSGDYGFPENAEYEQQIVAKSNLMSMEELKKRRLEDDYC